MTTCSTVVGHGVRAPIVTNRVECPSMSGDEVASAIDDFLGDRGGPYAWDEFISTPLSDPFLEEIRITAAATHERFPPPDGRGWCNEEGVAVLRQLAARAREYARGTSST